jgi:TonB-dependent SusC/RagA subfamily outer membrane receptor
MIGVVIGIVGWSVSVSSQTLSTAYTALQERPASESLVTQGSATQGRSKEAIKVTLVVRDKTIEYAVNEIARQAKLQPVFVKGDPTLSKRISVRITKAPVMEALATILAGTGMTAKLASDGETLMIRPQEQTAAPQGVQSFGMIGGKVVDSATGRGISGSTVNVVGTKLTAVTNDEGGFVIKNVPIGEQTLTAKAFGYRSATRVITVPEGKLTYTNVITLTSVPTSLSSVVTTAAGIQRKMEVGNDITVLDVQKIMQTAPVNTVTDLLENRVPGMVVMRSSGAPGSPSRIRLRGSRSVSRSDEPIIIIDGVRLFAEQDKTRSVAGPLQLDQIDPNSIDKIEVFKGPSASALYGSDAANGVIVITTKRGKAGRTNWTLTAERGRATLPGKWPTNTFRFGYEQYFAGVRVRPCNDPYDIILCDSVVKFQALNQKNLTVLGTGDNQLLSLSVDGGVGDLTYALTGSVNNDIGIMQLPPWERKKFTQRLGIPVPGWMKRPDRYKSSGITSRLELPLGRPNSSVMLSTSVSNSQQQRSSLQSALTRLQGAYIDTTLLTDTRPLLLDYFHRVRYDQWTMTNTLQFNYPVTPWFPLLATFGLSSASRENTDLLPRGYLNQDSTGEYRLTQGSSLNKTINLGTTLSVPSRGRIPGITVSTGLQVYAQDQKALMASATEIPLGVSEPTALTNNTTRSAVSTATYGWYIAPTINVNSRFFVNPGFRFDGGTASGANANFSPFPKLDFAWIALDRPEDPLFGALTMLRPRVAFGIAGVQPNPGSQLRLLQVESVARPGNTTVEQIVTINTIGNTLLKPERSRELEGGVEAWFGAQRLTLSLTGYRTVRYDAIVGVPVAASAAVLGNGLLPIIDKNVGTVLNKGVEATVDARIFDNALVDWSVGTQLSKVNNRVLKLAPGQDVIDNNDVSTGSSFTRIIPGYPLLGRWAYPLAGYEDSNGNGLIEPNEVRVSDSAIYVGAQEPNYTWTANTTLSLFQRRLTLNTAVAYQNGMTQYNQGANYISGGISNAFLSAAFDPNTPLSYQALIAASIGSSSRFSSDRSTDIGLIQRVNMLRWSSLALTYQAPPSLAKHVRASSLSLSLQGSNLALKTNYRGKDPNVNSAIGGSSMIDGGEVPQPRLWQLRIRMGF